MEAGLPNITEELVHIFNRTSSTGTGAFTYTNVKNQVLAGGTDSYTRRGNFTFDASLSSPTYNNSDTVTPASLTTFLLIKY